MPAVVVRFDGHHAIHEVLELAREPEVREQHSEEVARAVLLQEVRHRPVESKGDARRVAGTRTVGEPHGHETHERSERQSRGTCAPARIRRRGHLRRRAGPRRTSPAGCRRMRKYQRDERYTDEGHARELGDDRHSGGEAEERGCAPARARDPALQRVERQQRGGGRRDIEARKRSMPEHGRHRHEEHHCQERRTFRGQEPPRPQPGDDEQQREKGQHAKPRKRQITPVRSLHIEDVETLGRPLRRWGAEGARAREIGPDGEQHAPERRMLGVVLVLAAIEQLDAGREVLGLVPGVGVHTPAAGRQQTGREDDERQYLARRRRRTGGKRGAAHPANGCRSTMVSSRSGPVEIMSIGTLTRVSRRSR